MKTVKLRVVSQSSFTVFRSDHKVINYMKKITIFFLHICNMYMKNNLYFLLNQNKALENGLV